MYLYIFYFSQLINKIIASIIHCIFLLVLKSCMFMINVFFCFSGTAIVPIFSAILQTPYIQEINTVKTFGWLLKVFPSFALGSGFGNLFSISFANAFCESIDPKYLNFSCVENPKKGDSVFKCCKGLFILCMFF